MNLDDLHWTDRNCRFHATCAMDPCGGVSTCPDGHEKSLFVPLAKRWYVEFREGRKDIEFRPAGIVTDKNGVLRQSPWNASTCRPGRPALIGNGYQVRDRLSAVVESFTEQPDAGDFTEAFDEIYPGHRSRGGLVAAIKFRSINLPRNTP